MALKMLVLLCLVALSGAEFCNYRGQHVAVGGQIPDPNGCGSCTCHDDGLIYCTQMRDCNSCFMGNTKFAVGEVTTLECNTCTCSYGGRWACTRKMCPRPL